MSKYLIVICIVTLSSCSNTLKRYVNEKYPKADIQKIEFEAIKSSILHLSRIDEGHISISLPTKFVEDTITTFLNDSIKNYLESEEGKAKLHIEEGKVKLNKLSFRHQKIFVEIEYNGVFSKENKINKSKIAGLKEVQGTFSFSFVPQLSNKEVTIQPVLVDFQFKEIKASIYDKTFKPNRIKNSINWFVATFKENITKKIKPINISIEIDPIKSKSISDLLEKDILEGKIKIIKDDSLKVDVKPYEVAFLLDSNTINFMIESKQKGEYERPLQLEYQKIIYPYNIKGFINQCYGTDVIVNKSENFRLKNQKVISNILPLKILNPITNNDIFRAYNLYKDYFNKKQLLYFDKLDVNSDKVSLAISKKFVSKVINNTFKELDAEFELAFKPEPEKMEEFLHLKDDIKVNCKAVHERCPCCLLNPFDDCECWKCSCSGKTLCQAKNRFRELKCLGEKFLEKLYMEGGRIGKIHSIIKSNGNIQIALNKISSDNSMQEFKINTTLRASAKANLDLKFNPSGVGHLLCVVNEHENFDVSINLSRTTSNLNTRNSFSHENQNMVINSEILFEKPLMLQFDPPPGIKFFSNPEVFLNCSIAFLGATIFSIKTILSESKDENDRELKNKIKGAFLGQYKFKPEIDFDIKIKPIKIKIVNVELLSINKDRSIYFVEK